MLHEEVKSEYTPVEQKGDIKQENNQMETTMAWLRFQKLKCLVKVRFKIDLSFSAEFRKIIYKAGVMICYVMLSQLLSISSAHNTVNLHCQLVLSTLFAKEVTKMVWRTLKTLKRLKK